MCSKEQTPLFRDLTGEDADPEVTEIESLCMYCHANGTTRLLLTRIPHYKNVVIMSFSCEQCGFANNEIQQGGAYSPMGVRWRLRVEDPVDLNRQVVKSDYTSVKIPEIDFEIPAKSMKGEVTTVEGIVTRAIRGLGQDQKKRMEEHPEAAEKIERFIVKLNQLLEMETKWTIEIEDISGDCFVENPEIPHKDPRCERTDFTRTKEQDQMLGIYAQDEVGETTESSLLTTAPPDQGSYDNMSAEEVLQFRTNCPSCNALCDTNMKLTKIPHFKEVVIMATVCDACGHRTNEVKSGGGVEDRGVRFEVRVANKDDFSRDILKSETCMMEIPELECEVGGRALGGRFTTAEGLLRATLEQIAESPGVIGDAPSINEEGKNVFLQKLNEALEGKRAVTIILDDPAGNSYVQSLSDDPEIPDDGLKITRYERSFEQNDELGLNDLKVEGYENES